MSTAHLVPETRDLTGDDAYETLRRTGRRRLLADAFKRLRVSDGFSHARSLAFLSVLVVVQGIIALVGLASVIGNRAFSEAVVAAIKGTSPGPSGDLLTAAATQAQATGDRKQIIAVVLGLAGCLFTATTMLGQFERALNRIYGVESDRPTTQKYGFAFVLACAVGACLVAAFACVAYGGIHTVSLDGGTIDTAWQLVRWPLALVLVAGGLAALSKWSPRRRQPRWSWLAYGAGLGTALWVLSTLLLGLFFRWSSTFGETYGPLAGIVALCLWALISSIALCYGAAVSAQLEAVRAQASVPQDKEKVAESEPDADDRADSALLVSNAR